VLFDEIEGAMVAQGAPVYRLTLFGLKSEPELVVAQQ